MALAGAPATTAIVASLPREKQGVASAVNDVSRELGGALGIAVLGSVMNTAYRSGVTDATAALPPAPRARHGVARRRAARRCPAGPGGGELIGQAQAAYMDGFGRARRGAAALLLGAVFVALRAPGRAESRENAGIAAPGAEEPALA